MVLVINVDQVEKDGNDMVCFHDTVSWSALVEFVDPAWGLNKAGHTI